MAPARRWIWRVIVGSGHARGEILAGHAAADDVGELESDRIDLAQRLGIGTVRAAIVVGALFRRLFVTRLLDLHGAGKLVFFGKLAGLGDRCVFLRHLAQVRRKRWVVYAKPPFAGPEAVLAYLSRYTQRVAISNGRAKSGQSWERWDSRGKDGQAQTSRNGNRTGRNRWRVA